QPRGTRSMRRPRSDPPRDLDSSWLACSTCQTIIVDAQARRVMRRADRFMRDGGDASVEDGLAWGHLWGQVQGLFGTAQGASRQGCGAQKNWPDCGESH